MNHRAFFSGGTAVFLALATVASTANAQMSESERKSAARAAFQEGVALQQQGKIAEALARFQAGEKLYDAPTISLRVAQCQVLLGKLVQGAETYEELVRRNLDADASDAFIEAQKQAAAELPAVRQRIPTLRVTIKPDAASLSNLHVIENDADIPAELLGIARPINPGIYKLHAVADGWTTTTPVDVRIAEKENKSVELVLVQQAGAGYTEPPAPVPPSYHPTVEASKSGYTYPRPETKSSTTGFLLGVRGGVLVPGGDDGRGTSLSDAVKSGPLLGVDGYLRLQNLLLGLSVDNAWLGEGGASVPGPGGKGTEASKGGNTTYVGLSIGLLANVDRASFIGNVGLGYRKLSYKTSPANLMGTNVYDSTGGELMIDGGIAIPAGPLRIIPKISLSAGSFGSDKSGKPKPSVSNQYSIDDDTPNAYVTLTLSLGLYYHFDLGKKPPPPAAPSPAPANSP